jgi:ribosomal protein S18 acetylase RimI-like enzyme
LVWCRRTEGEASGVGPDNPARRLYERHGFQVIGTVDGSLTMLLPR